MTEYHSLTSWNERKLRENGYNDRIERYNQTLRGYASSKDFYGYETPDGFVKTGTDSVDDPEQQLQRLVDDLDIREVETDNEVPEEIKEQLERLGYA